MAGPRASKLLSLQVGQRGKTYGQSSIRLVRPRLSGIRPEAADPLPSSDDRRLDTSGHKLLGKRETSLACRQYRIIILYRQVLNVPAF